ncbi:MAG: TIR domain-containing protein [Devosia sp.]
MAQPSLKVFISYARRDADAFAEDLLAGLGAAGFEASLDRHDIAAGEDWEARLEGLIAQADTVVFVVTPAAVQSERCAWEVAKADFLGKRVLPVVAIDVADDQLPSALSRRNFIFFSRDASFAKALFQLASALRTDVKWLREHTRLTDIARRWRDRNKSELLLLRGAELDAARAWLAETPDNETAAPTLLQRDFIESSIAYDTSQLRVERERLESMAAAQGAKEEALRNLSRRTILGLGASGTLAVAASGLAYWGVNAEARFQEARRRSEEAVKVARDEEIQRQVDRKDLTGQLTVFSTLAGEAAYDGDGDNSPFTSAVLNHLADRDTSLFDAIVSAQAEILAQTSGLQRPYISTDFNGEIFLSRPSDRKLKATVVGVSNYINISQLKNPRNDAAAWSSFLKGLGFATVDVFDPTLETLQSMFPVTSIDEASAPDMRDSSEVKIVKAGISVGAQTAPLSSKAIEPNSLELFFYAGNGVSIEGVPYLLPVDVDAKSPETAISTSMRLSAVSDQLRRRAQASVLIVDSNFTDAYGTRSR